MIMFVVFSRLLFLSEEDVISFDDAAQRDQNQKMFPKRYLALYVYENGNIIVIETKVGT